MNILSLHTEKWRNTKKNGRTLALQVSEVLEGYYNHMTKV
jgi:hypothetical protein